MRKLTPAYLALVNEIVPKATAEGAYCIGIVSVLAWQNGLEPDRLLLDLAADRKGIKDALSVFIGWRRYATSAALQQIKNPSPQDNGGLSKGEI